MPLACNLWSCGAKLGLLVRQSISMGESRSLSSWAENEGETAKSLLPNRCDSSGMVRQGTRADSTFTAAADVDEMP